MKYIIYTISFFVFQACCTRNDGNPVPSLNEIKLVSEEISQIKQNLNGASVMTLYRENPNLGADFSFLDKVDFTQFDVLYVLVNSNHKATEILGKPKCVVFINIEKQEINVATSFKTKYCNSILIQASSVSVPAYVGWLKVPKLPTGYKISSYEY
jgi:hypothetical protein